MDAAEAAVVERAPALAEGAEDEFVAMYQATFRRVYAYVRSLVADVETAEDLTGRVYLKAVKARQRAPGADRQLFWLFRLARTTVIDYYRTDGRRRTSSVSLEELAEVSDTRLTPEERVLARERTAGLLEAMGALGDGDRNLLVLKFACGQTNQEIGFVLGVSPAAVSMRLMRALRHLRRRLIASDRRP